MKYLITGYKGFIGQNLVKYLKNLGHEVEGVDYPFDLCYFIPPFSNIDIVVHLAAETNVRTSILAPGITFIRNCYSMSNAIESARLNNAKFVFASSCAAPESTSPYGASKFACEALCWAYKKSFNLDISILRLANVYGPCSSKKASVIAKFIKLKMKGEPIEIYGTGHQKRDFVYVDDVCKAIVESPEFLNVSTGRLTSINSLADMLKIKNIKNSPPINGEIFHPETSKWDGCEVELEEGLERTIKWFINTQ